MDLRDLQAQIELLQLKVNALTNHAYNHLGELEVMIEQDWIKKNPITRRYLVEQMQDCYINATIISDIEKDVERLYEEFCKEKADTSRNTLASDEVPAGND